MSRNSLYVNCLRPFRLLLTSTFLWSTHGSQPRSHVAVSSNYLKTALRPTRRWGPPAEHAPARFQLHTIHHHSPVSLTCSTCGGNCLLPVEFFLGQHACLRNLADPSNALSVSALFSTCLRNLADPSNALSVSALFSTCLRTPRPSPHPTPTARSPQRRPGDEIAPDRLR